MSSPLTLVLRRPLAATPEEWRRPQDRNLGERRRSPPLWHPTITESDQSRLGCLFPHENTTSHPVPRLDADGPRTGLPTRQAAQGIKLTTARDTSDDSSPPRRWRSGRPTSSRSSPSRRFKALDKSTIKFKLTEKSAASSSPAIPQHFGRSIPRDRGEVSPDHRSPSGSHRASADRVEADSTSA